MSTKNSINKKTVNKFQDESRFLVLKVQQWTTNEEQWNGNVEAALDDAREAMKLSGDMERCLLLIEESMVKDFLADGW